MRVRTLVASLVLLAVVPAAGAWTNTSGAPPFPVSIVQGKPIPTTAYALIGGKVTWRNRDRAARRIKSDTNAWTAFTLRPGRSKTVTFRRRGCFRYKVDGRARGAVAVATTCGGGGGGGGSTKTVIYHYDVALLGHVKETQTTTGDRAADLNGTLTLALDWRGTFANVAVKKVVVGSTFVIAMNGGLFGSGTMSGTHDFSDTRGRLGGPCQGRVTIPSSAARFAAGGSRIPSGPSSEFHLAAQMLLEPGTAMFNSIYAAQAAACKTSTKGLPRFPFEEKDVQGLTVSPEVILLQMDADRRDETGRLWFPLDRLSTGQGFTIDTGLVTADTTANCGTTRCTSEGQLKITLTPRR